MSTVSANKIRQWSLSGWFFPWYFYKNEASLKWPTKPFQQESRWWIVEIKGSIYDFPVHVNSIEISAYFKNLFFKKNVNNFNWNPTINSSHLLSSCNKAQSPDIKRQLLHCYWLSVALYWLGVDSITLFRRILSVLQCYIHPLLYQPENQLLSKN